MPRRSTWKDPSCLTSLGGPYQAQASLRTENTKAQLCLGRSTGTCLGSEVFNGVSNPSEQWCPATEPQGPAGVRRLGSGLPQTFWNMQLNIFVLTVHSSFSQHGLYRHAGCALKEPFLQVVRCGVLCTRVCLDTWSSWWCPWERLWRRAWLKDVVSILALFPVVLSACQYHAASHSRPARPELLLQPLCLPAPERVQISQMGKTHVYEMKVNES